MGCAGVEPGHKDGIRFSETGRNYEESRGKRIAAVSLLIWKKPFFRDSEEEFRIRFGHIVHEYHMRNLGPERGGRHAARRTGRQLAVAPVPGERTDDYAPIAGGA